MDCLKDYHVWDAKFSELGKDFCPRHNPNNVEDAFRRLPQSKDEYGGINNGAECALGKTLAPIPKADPMRSVIFNLKVLFPNNRRTI